MTESRQRTREDWAHIADCCIRARSPLYTQVVTEPQRERVISLAADAGLAHGYDAFKRALVDAEHDCAWLSRSYSHWGLH